MGEGRCLAGKRAGDKVDRIIRTSSSQKTILCFLRHPTFSNFY